MGHHLAKRIRERREQVAISLCSHPTKERLAKAGGLEGGRVEVGDDKQGTRVYTFRDGSLDRLRISNAINSLQFIALQKYRHHWHHSGMDSHMGSVDLNRIFANDVFSMGHMPKSEAQAHHRQQYRDAVKKIGMIASMVVERVVCHDRSRESVGLELGHKAEWKARAAVHDILVKAADRLIALWGLQGRRA